MSSSRGDGARLAVSKARTRAASPGLAWLASLAFVALGLPDGLLGVAWPSMRKAFEVSLDALGPLLVSFTSGYVASSSCGGRLVARLGLGWLLALSCLATGASLLGYASTGSWSVVLALAFAAGLGAGGIDTGINTHAATHHGPRLLNWLHACYGIGAAGGPALLTAVLSAGEPWQRGYVIVGAAQLALAAAFVATLRAWPASSGSQAAAASEVPVSPSATLRLPVMRWSIGLFFAYTGLELAVGTWTYTLLTEGRGVSLRAAGSSTSLFWAALTGGRVLGAVVASRVPAAVLVRGCLLVLGTGLALLAAGLGPTLDRVGLIAAGAAAGPVFPTLIASTPARVGGAHVGNAVGFQIAAAALGQSLIPALLGVVGDGLGLDALAAGLFGAGIVVLLVHGGVEARSAVLPRDHHASERAAVRERPTALELPRPPR